MSAIAPPTPRRSPGDHHLRTPPRLPSRQSSPAPPAPTANPHHRGGIVLFEVPFHSAMSDADLDTLRHVLDLSTHMHPKMRPDPNSPGVARLDHFSGLFLERRSAEGEWTLEGRTWGKPASETVHEWHLLAAQAARQLDPSVTLPERLLHTRLEMPDRPLGQAATGRLAHLRRRLVGLP
jgi:hypothetical protein